MTNDERNPKPEGPNAFNCAVAGFVLWISLVVAHWSLVIQRLRQMRFLVPMRARSERGLSMNHEVAQASRLRVHRASRSVTVLAARRRPNSQPGTAALRSAGSWSQCMRKKRKGALHEPERRTPVRHRAAPRMGRFGNRRSRRVQGPDACAERKRALHEPSCLEFRLQPVRAA